MPEQDAMVNDFTACYYTFVFIQHNGIAQKSNNSAKHNGNRTL